MPQRAHTTTCVPTRRTRNQRCPRIMHQSRPTFTLSPPLRGQSGCETAAATSQPPSTRVPTPLPAVPAWCGYCYENEPPQQGLRDGATMSASPAQGVRARATSQGHDRASATTSTLPRDRHRRPPGELHCPARRRHRRVSSLSPIQRARHHPSRRPVTDFTTFTQSVLANSTAPA